MEFHVIKENDLFYLSDPRGNIPVTTLANHQYGLYTRDTRVLSRFEWRCGPVSLVPLDSSDAENYQAVYRYTNLELVEDGIVKVPRECMLVTRKHFVDGARFCEMVTLKNYAACDIELDIAYVINSDFVDMFHVRGFFEGGRGHLHPTEYDGNSVRFHYTAKDGVETSTKVHFHIPGRVTFGNSTEISFDAEHKQEAPVDNVEVTSRVKVAAKAEISWIVVIETESDMEGLAISDSLAGSIDKDENALTRSVEQARMELHESYKTWSEAAPKVLGNEWFSRWYDRGISDLRMLMTDFGYGLFPVAGVPWYAVPFGRDSLITALQMLCAHPEIAKGTLRTMAASQGEKVDSSRDEQPGKVMHELRAGELSRTGQVPFSPYYGTIDATPLFIVLAAEYFLWTGDIEFITGLTPNIERAFEWIEKYGDRDGDGFVEYYQEASKGIANQGWKDSGDSLVHKDGTFAKAPIALCEVQGYVFRAYDLWADIYERLNDMERSSHCRDRAAELRTRFVEEFWMDSEAAVALALDGDKNRVESHSSNMGQVLWSGILPKTHAKRLVKRLLEPDMFSGYGIRTLSASEVAYNPLSYHNGSVWPHDNSIILVGMQRYGCAEAVNRVVSGLMRSARECPLMRLPELFAGYSTEEVKAPVPYPVSCSPQAWAAGTPVLALQALLGISPDVNQGVIRMNPVLPEEIHELQVTGIRVGAGHLDVFLVRTAAGDVAMTVQSNTTGLAVQVGDAF